MLTKPVGNKAIFTYILCVCAGGILGVINEPFAFTAVLKIVFAHKAIYNESKL